MEFQIINGDLIILLHRADYVWESDMREQSFFVGRDVGKKERKKRGRPAFLLKHVLYGLLPVSVMRVFLLWCRQSGGSVTVGCSSLSPGSERVLNLDVTQGDGEAMTHKEPVSGRPVVNKCICFRMGMISGKPNISPRHFRKICCFVLSWHSWGKQNEIHSWSEVIEM